MPSWVDRLLNAKPLLKIAASMAGSTRASGLEDMTISMLLGEEGQQKEELEHLTEWIATHCRPDVIHISTALLLGLARRLKERTGAVIVCSLQDEDVWVDAVHPAFREKIWKLMHNRAANVDALVSVSGFFAEKMQQRMNLPAEKTEIIHLGIDVEEYSPHALKDKELNIGYLSRMCHENGFDIVIDAFILLKKQAGFERVKLIASGGSTGDDSRFIREQQKKLKAYGLSGDFEILSDFEGRAVHQFFSRVSLLSVPVRMGEAFGIYLLESMASGVPVVQPALGAFPEIVERTGGGRIYKPNSPEALCAAWAGLLSDPEAMEQLSRAGYEGTKREFDIHKKAKEITALYQKLLT
jgi:glycosyltransferase involved in cell wall biosynthesis